QSCPAAASSAWIARASPRLISASLCNDRCGPWYSTGLTGKNTGAPPPRRARARACDTSRTSTMADALAREANVGHAALLHPPEEADEEVALVFDELRLLPFEGVPHELEAPAHGEH